MYLGQIYVISIFWGDKYNFWPKYTTLNLQWDFRLLHVGYLSVCASYLTVKVK